jgi:ribosomal protein S8
MRQYQNNSIANCIARINLGYAAKQLYIELPESKQLRDLLLALMALGVVQSFSSRPRPCNSLIAQRSSRLSILQTGGWRYNTVGGPDSRIIVYLKYYNTLPVFSSMRNYWLSRRKISIPYTGLQGTHVKGTKAVFVLWTNVGFLTNTECLRLRIGGLLVCGLFALLCDFRHVTLS